MSLPAPLSAKITKTTGLLLLLFGISILASQSLMDLFSTLICGYLLAQMILARRRGISFQPIHKMGFEWLWGAWFVVAALGFLVNQPPPVEAPPHFWLARLVEYKWILILYFLVAAFHLADFKIKALHWFNGAALACSLYAIVVYFQELQAHPDQEWRLGGLFQFSMTHAHVYGIFFCALLGAFFWSYKDLTRPMKALFSASLLAVGTSVLLTYTRGAWIGVLAGVLVMGYLWSFRKGLVLTLLTALIAASLYAFVPGVQNRVKFTAKMANAEEAKKSYDSERVVLWKTNLMIFKDHPWLGTGYGQNKFLLHKYYEKQGLPKDQFIGHAHNQYLHLLAGTGILGLLCYLGVLGIFAWLTLKAYLQTPVREAFHKGLALGALGGQVVFAIGGLTESNFEHSKVRFASMLMWALGLWLWQRVKLPKP